MTGYRAIFSILIVTAAGALGYLSGPLLARAHPKVRLAARVAAEEKGERQIRTLSSQAARRGGTSPAELYARARSIEQQMSLGGALLGGWCGLVVAFKLAFGRDGSGKDTYDIDVSRCVACGRCFASCPHDEHAQDDTERLRGKR